MSTTQSILHNTCMYKQCLGFIHYIHIYYKTKIALFCQQKENKNTKDT